MLVMWESGEADSVDSFHWSTISLEKNRNKGHRMLVGASCPQGYGAEAMLQPALLWCS